MVRPPGARTLVANGALSILAALFVALAVGAAPFSRLMLVAHIQLVMGGMLSVSAWIILVPGVRRSGVPA